ncbi:unnamed protein product, partial [Mesorhabditis belari]|uniref:Protein UBASH3A homolog n=1 Tax=Mesorhabditis belari TaxID=2138241 RepID=A0AAF3EE49_9BILA
MIIDWPTMDHPRRIVIVRHGERCDFVFNQGGVSWMKRAFDSNGRYTPFDVNLPRIVPKRKDGWQKFAMDTPLTEMGYLQSKLTGRSLRDKNLRFEHVFCSSALRCVQTAVGIMKGLGDGKAQINIEPGLYEWMQWCRMGRPSWMSPQELSKLGYPVNTQYTPIQRDDALRMEENLYNYYERSFQIVQEIIRKCPTGNILIVGHGASLETLTRQLCGSEPRNNEDFFYLLHNTPYLSSIQVAEHKGRWSLAGSPIPPLTHSSNGTYDGAQLQWNSSTLQERVKNHFG